MITSGQNIHRRSFIRTVRKSLRRLSFKKSLKTSKETKRAISHEPQHFSTRTKIKGSVRKQRYTSATISKQSIFCI